MALIEFKDLPDTTTPITAGNLNNNFNELSLATDEAIKLNDSNIKIDSQEIINITPINGSNYDNYGNCWYYKKGTRVHIHLGLSGLTSNLATNIFVLPEGYRPHTKIILNGRASGFNDSCGGDIDTNGLIRIASTTTYAFVMVEYDVFD